MTPPEITREEANKLIANQAGKPMETLVMNYQGKWWDIRGMKNSDVQEFIGTLIGDKRVDVRHFNLSV